MTVLTSMHARHRIVEECIFQAESGCGPREPSFATRLISIGVAVHEELAQSAPYLYAPPIRTRVAVSKQMPNEGCVASSFRRIRGGCLYRSMAGVLWQ